MSPKRALILMTLCLLAGSTYGQTVQERVINLPEISNQYVTTIVYGSPLTPKDNELYAAFRNNPTLQKIAQQTILNEWTTNDKFVQKSDWATYLGNQRPAVLIQRPSDQNGRSQPVFFASGKDLNVQLLPHQIVQRLSEDCPRCPQPNQPVQPIAPVTPIPAPIPLLLPKIVEPQEDEQYIPLLAFALPFLGAGFGLAGSYKKSR